MLLLFQINIRADDRCFIDEKNKIYTHEFFIDIIPLKTEGLCEDYACFKFKNIDPIIKTVEKFLHLKLETKMNRKKYGSFVYYHKLSLDEEVFKDLKNLQLLEPFIMEGQWPNFKGMTIKKIRNEIETLLIAYKLKEKRKEILDELTLIGY